jgi:hypothetical protein
MLRYTPNNAIYLKYCRALLYIDNSIKPMNFVKHFCDPAGTNDVQFIQVGETSVDPPFVSFSDPFFNRFKNKEGALINKYLAYIYANPDGGDHFDIKSGIQASKHDKQIKQWIAHVQNRISLGELNDQYRACVLLDWDRTLTMFEGVYRCPLDQLRTPAFMNDMLVYLFNGRKRLEYIRELIQTFIDNGIVPYVFTNNGLCKTEQFRLLYTALHGGLQLLCSNEGLKHNLVLEKEFFAQMCRPVNTRSINTSVKHFNNIVLKNRGNRANANVSAGAGAEVGAGGINNNTTVSAGAGAGSANNLVGGRRKKKHNKTSKIKRIKQGV